MDSVLDQIGEWLKELLVSGIMNQLTGLFDSVNTQVGDIATQVGTTPANFSPGVFAMIRNVSESVIIPVAGLILTFIACYELIQIIIDHNNLANFETWIFFKWVFKTFADQIRCRQCGSYLSAAYGGASGGILQPGIPLAAEKGDPKRICGSQTSRRSSGKCKCGSQGRCCRDKDPWAEAC